MEIIQVSHAVADGAMVGKGIMIKDEFHIIGGVFTKSMLNMMSMIKNVMC